jgi:small multidrug resistance family-3 protein
MPPLLRPDPPDASLVMAFGHVSLAGNQPPDRAMANLPPLFFLILATTLEAFGDAVVRMGVYNHTGLARTGLFLGGAGLLFGYGLMLNLAPLEFGRVVGLYIATLFVVWQMVNFITFRTLPTPPILVGGALIIAGGMVVTYWRTA